MKKFLVLYLGGGDQMANASQEEKDASMKTWMDWFTKVGSAVVDQGNPTGVTKLMGKGNATLVTGYSMMQGNSIDEVVKMLEDNPQMQVGGVEVLEIMPIM